MMSHQIIKFVSEKTLPKEWIIPSSGQHFYRFGFSQFRNGCTDRSKLYHPLLIFVITMAYSLRCIYSALTPPVTPDYHLLIGDWGYFIDMQFHLNLTVVLVLCVGQLSQIVDFNEYVGGRGQPHMNVFNIISGQITPHSIGLTDERILTAIL